MTASLATAAVAAAAKEERAWMLLQFYQYWTAPIGSLELLLSGSTGS